jgi:hypothetical protein
MGGVGSFLWTRQNESAGTKGIVARVGTSCRQALCDLQGVIVDSFGTAALVLRSLTRLPHPLPPEDCCPAGSGVPPARQDIWQGYVTTPGQVTIYGYWSDPSALPTIIRNTSACESAQQMTTLARVVP